MTYKEIPLSQLQSSMTLYEAIRNPNSPDSIFIGRDCQPSKDQIEKAKLIIEGDPLIKIKIKRSKLVLEQALGEFSNSLNNLEIAFLTDSIRDEVLSISKEILIINNNILKVYEQIKETQYDLVNHSINVSIMSLCFGKFLGFSNKKLLSLGSAAVVHDIGKKLDSRIGELVQLQRQLTDEEMFYITRHSHLGQRYFDRIKEPLLAAACGGHHWPRYGNEPRTNEEREISEILKLVDVKSALIEDRPYSRSRTTKEALEIMIKMNKEELREKGLYRNDLMNYSISELKNLGYFLTDQTICLDQDYFDKELFLNFLEMFGGRNKRTLFFPHQLKEIDPFNHYQSLEL